MTRVVIPIGRGRPDTLPYVLRSLSEHAGVTEVITVGERPKGIEPDQHIDSPNDGQPHVNIAGHLRRVCESIDGEFIWCDDDMFTMKPWTPGVYVRPFSIAYMLSHNANRGYWSQAVRNSIKVMKQWGHDPETVPCGPTHRPWLINTERTIEIVDALDAVGGGSFRALYVAGLDGLIEVSDPKIWGRGMPKPGADVISVFNDSWRYNAGRIVKETFTEPSRWESAPTEGMAVAARGPARARHRHGRR